MEWLKRTLDNDDIAYLNTFSPETLGLFDNQEIRASIAHDQVQWSEILDTAKELSRLLPKKPDNVTITELVRNAYDLDLIFSEARLPTLDMRHVVDQIQLFVIIVRSLFGPEFFTKGLFPGSTSFPLQLTPSQKTNINILLGSPYSEQALRSGLITPNDIRSLQSSIQVFMEDARGTRLLQLLRILQIDIQWACDVLPVDRLRQVKENDLLMTHLHMGLVRLSDMVRVTSIPDWRPEVIRPAPDIHQAFRALDIPRITALLNSNSTTTTHEGPLTLRLQVELGEMVQSEQDRKSLAYVLRHMFDFPPSQEMLFHAVLNFVGTQPLRVKRRYMEIFLSDCLNAWGPGRISCPRGVWERLLTSLHGTLIWEYADKDIPKNIQDIVCIIQNGVTDLMEGTEYDFDKLSSEALIQIKDKPTEEREKAFVLAMKKAYESSRCPPNESHIQNIVLRAQEWKQKGIFEDEFLTTLYGGHKRYHPIRYTKT